MPGGQMRGEIGIELWQKMNTFAVGSKRAASLSSLSTHQYVALVIVGQKRLPDSLVEVRVAVVALEVKDAEFVERKLITAVIKLVVFVLFQRWGGGC